MDKKKIIAAITAISLSAGVASIATACGDSKPHDHTFSTEWSTSETEHWHDATCEHEGEVDSDRGAHADEDGNKLCDQCGYNMNDPVALTIGTFAGGKVTADKDAYKEGDAVVLTVKPDAGHSLKSIKLGDADKTADVADGKLSFTITADTTVTATFEANAMTLTVTDEDSIDGKVEFESTTGYRYGDNVTLVVTPETDYYKCTSLKLSTDNRTDYATQIVDGKVTVPSVKTENLTVTAVFEVAYRDISVTVKGRKTGNVVTILPADTEVKIASGVTLSTDENGKVDIVKAEIGKTIYIGSQGYKDGTVTVGEDSDYQITLEYITFEAAYHNANSAGGGDGDQWEGYYGTPDKIDVSHVNDAQPYFTVNDNAGDFYQYTVDLFVDVYASMTARSAFSASEPMIGLVFDDDGTNKTVMARVQKINGDEYKVQWVGGRIWMEQNINGDWDFAGSGIHSYNPIAPSLKVKYEGTGLEFALLRKGNTVYALVDGIIASSQTLPDGWGDKECRVVYSIPGVTGGGLKIPFTVKEVGDTAELTAATVEHGALSLDKTTANIGEDVTVTMTPDSGYKLVSLKINGADVSEFLSGPTYTFKAAGDTEITAEFGNIVYGSIAASVTGRKFGINGNALKAGDAVTLSALGVDDITTALVQSGDALAINANDIPTGKWEVKISGYKAAEITVEEDTAYSTAIVLQSEETFEMDIGVLGWGSMSSVVAEDGSALLTVTNGIQYIVTKETYGDIAVTMHLGDAGTGSDTNRAQGISFKFADDKFAIVRKENNYIQVAKAGWPLDENGRTAGGVNWEQLAFLNDDDTTAYNNGDLPLTVVREGNILYVFLNGRYIGGRMIDEGYKESRVRVGVTYYSAQDNSPKTRKIEISDVDAAFEANNFRTAFGEGKVKVFGAWTENENKLSITGKGLLEFTADPGTVKESVKMTISASAAGEQGLIYTFDDGKFVAIRWQDTDSNGKIQFTMDIAFYSNSGSNSLASWADWALNSYEKAAFEEGDGLGLTLIRNGNIFYVVLDGFDETTGDAAQRVLATKSVDAKYATMDGAMGIQIYNGNGGAFAYEHKTDNAVVVPTDSAE